MEDLSPEQGKKGGLGIQISRRRGEQNKGALGLEKKDPRSNLDVNMAGKSISEGPEAV